MANGSSLSLLLLSSCLLFATVASASVQANRRGASHKDPPIDSDYCAKILGRAKGGTGDDDARGLAVVAGNLGWRTAHRAARRVREVEARARVEVTRTLLKDCRLLYAVAADGLKGAAGATGDGKFGEARINFSSAQKVAETCAKVLRVAEAGTSAAYTVNDQLYQIATVGVFLTSR